MTTFKQVKKMARYGDRVHKRIDANGGLSTYGYGKYSDKPGVVCYWQKGVGNCVSFDASKLIKIARRIRWKIEYYGKRILGVY